MFEIQCTAEALDQGHRTRLDNLCRNVRFVHHVCGNDVVDNPQHLATIAVWVANRYATETESSAPIGAPAERERPLIGGDEKYVFSAIGH